jgi:hypothetical protein
MGDEQGRTADRQGISRRSFVEKAASGAVAVSALSLVPGQVEASPRPHRRQAVGSARNSHYPSNRAPLVPSVYVPLPPGAVRPAGWLDRQLRGWADGMTGRLDEVWPDVGADNGWLGGPGDIWERGPYWVDGLLPLGHVLQDQRLIDKANLWVEAAIGSRQPGGYFGPVGERPQPGSARPVPGEDWWPHMIMLKILQNHYEATSDGRVLDLMTEYFRFQLRELPSKPLGHYTWWGKQRGGENLASAHWLYNRTGDAFLLELGQILHAQTERWATRPTEDPGRWHVVNTAMGIKQPGLWYAQTGFAEDWEPVDRLIDWLMTNHGQPQGIWSGDEELHGTDPRQGVETCAIVEYMFSLESLLPIGGDLRHAEILEKLAYNALPAALSPGFGGRHYYQRPNQVACTLGKRSFTVRHEDDTLIGLVTGYGCCTANLHQGWPKYVQHMWFATPDDGLAALVYGPCQVTARVADGTEIRIVEETEYPFEEKIRLEYHGPSGLRFPLHLRVPSWADNSTVRVTGESPTIPVAGTIHRMDRLWNDGDVVELEFPMTVRASRGHENSVSLELGPLLLALPRQEEWKQVGGGDPFGDWEIRTSEPWNYGLRQDDIAAPEGAFDIRRGDVPQQPWASGTAPGIQSAGPPLQVGCVARRVDEWQPYGVDTGPLPWSPIRSGHPDESIILVPYGSTKIRISEFPVVI